MTNTTIAPDQRFRDAMASFPSGVTIVTTKDDEGRWWGFTATSFCSVSMSPPMVLVCLADTAECYPAFNQAQRWMIHVLPHEHTELALRFATRGADKFTDADFVADSSGLPVLRGASVTLECTAYAKHPGGDHTILLGMVEETHLGKEPPIVYFRRQFHPVGRAPSLTRHSVVQSLFSWDFEQV